LEDFKNAYYNDWTTKITILYNIVQLSYIFLYTSVYFFILLQTKGRNTHRGSLLEAAVKESSINITQMVKRMGIARGTYYNHKSDPNLSFEQLAKYGRVLKHDFSQDLPEMKQYALHEPEALYGTPATINEAIEQRDYWREKYYQLMEKYHDLVTKMKDSPDT
jgi:ACT domain-containing protein